MKMKRDSKVSDKFQVSVPEEIRRSSGIKPGDKLVWEWDDEKKQIIITPIPSSVADALFFGVNNQGED
jgi:AbrB family looped-hinge helix DNA binding protein